MMQKFRINPNGAFSRFIFFVVAFTTLSSMLTFNTLHIERIDYLENNIPDIHSDHGVNNIPLLIMSPFILGVVAFFKPNKPIRTNTKRKKIGRSIKVNPYRFYYDIKSNISSTPITIRDHYGQYG